MIQITTAEIAPSPLLAPFVRCYTLREFDTKGLDLIKPWHASQEICMPFFFKAKPVKLINPQTGQIIRGGSYSDVTGIGTQFNGKMTFNGCYAFFEIVFRPNGFNKIFRIPASEMTNFITRADDIFDNQIKTFFDQLCGAHGLTQMGTLADAFLMLYLKKQKSIDFKDGLTAVANLILHHAAFLNVEQLADYANMSKRSFERHFIEQVGASPKLFCCVTRFNRAFALRLQHPEKDWAAIAGDCGYFDQAHLIKDFKKFAGDSPLSFLRQTPLTGESFTSRVDA